MLILSRKVGETVYLNEDIEKLIYKAIEDEIEFKLEQPKCPCFRGKEIFKKHIGDI